MGGENDALFEPVLKAEEAFQGHYLKLNRLTIRLPDGRRTVREIVKVRHAVVVLPINSDGTVHLVRQHRPAIGRTILEAPAGLIDGNESLESCARRECEEETGVVPEKLTRLTTYAHAEGYSNGWITLFLGTHLNNTGKISLDETEFVEQVVLPFDELSAMAENGKIVDSKTLLSVLLSRRYL